MLIIDRYFWPDTVPTADILKRVSGWIAASGREVSVLTAQPSYKPDVIVAKAPRYETVDGVKVTRLQLLKENSKPSRKYANHVIFSFIAFLKVLFGKRQDYILVQTSPPIIQALLISAAAYLRKSKFIYLLQDIHPDIGLVSNILPRGKFVASALRYLDTISLRIAAAIIVLSNDMRVSIAERGVSESKIRIIRNFALIGDCVPELAKAPSQPVRFVFAGNIGRFQRLDEIVEAFSLVSPQIAELEILGTGVRRDKLEELVKSLGSRNVRFTDHMPADAAFKHIRTFDIGIVSLLPGLIRYAYPSKTATYFAADLRVLAVVEGSSELAHAVRSLNVGEIVQPDSSAAGFAKKIKHMAMKIKSYAHPVAVARDLYDPEVMRRHWIELFDRLDAGS